MSHDLYPFPCDKLSHLLGPRPLERDVLYGRPLCIRAVEQVRQTQLLCCTDVLSFCAPLSFGRGSSIKYGIMTNGYDESGEMEVEFVKQFLLK